MNNQAVHSLLNLLHTAKAIAINKRASTDNPIEWNYQNGVVKGIDEALLGIELVTSMKFDRKAQEGVNQS
jgi:hypothetical protein